MVGKSGWRLGLIVSLAAGLLLSGDLILRDAGRWGSVDSDSLGSRYVGAQSNGYCCKHAAWTVCNPCLATAPACTSTPLTGACLNSSGQSQAECVQKDASYCVGGQGINHSGNVSVSQCDIFTGRTEPCDPNGQRCVVRSSMAVNITYTDCSPNLVSICPDNMQPFIPCTVP